MLSIQQYKRLQEYKELGLSKVKVSEKLNLSYKTICNWGDKDQAFFNAFQKSHEYVLDNYRQYIIILDEILYLNLPEEDLSLLYRGLMFLSESRSLICITNRGLSDWKNAARDKHTMQTLIDRIFRDAKLLYLN